MIFIILSGIIVFGAVLYIADNQELAPGIIVGGLLLCFNAAFWSLIAIATTDDDDIVGTETVTVSSVVINEEGDIFLTLEDGNVIVYEGSIRGTDNDVQPFLTLVHYSSEKNIYVPWNPGSYTEKRLNIPRTIYSKEN